jgi:hypothetical protein
MEPLASPKFEPRRRRAYLAALQRLTPSDRVAKAFELSEMAKSLLKDALRRRFPDRTESDLHELYLARLSKCHNNNY